MSSGTRQTVGTRRRLLLRLAAIHTSTPSPCDVQRCRTPWRAGDPALNHLWDRLLDLHHAAARSRRAERVARQGRPHLGERRAVLRDGVAEQRLLEREKLREAVDLHWACPAHARRTTSLIAGSPYAAGASSQSTTRVVTSAGRRRPASMRGITWGSSAAAWARPVKKRMPRVYRRPRGIGMSPPA